MRILITKSGENIFTEEEKDEIREKKFRSTTTNKYFKRKLTLEKIVHKKATGEYKKSRTNFNLDTNYPSKRPEEFFGRTTGAFFPNKIQISTESKSIPKLKRVKINLSKVSFPKELQAKYDIYKSEPKNDTVDYEEVPQKVNKFSNPNYKFSLGEIIDSKIIYELRKSIVAKERMEEKLSVVDESNFRTNYAKKPKVKQLDEILKYKKIKGDKSELIKYINTHNHLTDLFLKNLVTSDKYELEKHDKISQTLLFNKDMDKKFKFELEQKVKAKNNLNKIRGTNYLSNMEKEVKLESEILEKYRKKFDKKLNYLEKHKEFENSWKKHGIKYLTSKTYIPRKSGSKNNVSDDE